MVLVYGRFAVLLLSVRTYTLGYFKYSIYAVWLVESALYHVLEKYYMTHDISPTTQRGVHDTIFWRSITDKSSMIYDTPGMMVVVPFFSEQDSAKRSMYRFFFLKYGTEHGLAPGIAVCFHCDGYQILELQATCSPPPITIYILHSWAQKSSSLKSF